MKIKSAALGLIKKKLKYPTRNKKIFKKDKKQFVINFDLVFFNNK